MAQGKTPEPSMLLPANSSAGRARLAHGRVGAALRNRGPFISSGILNAAMSTSLGIQFFLPFILFLGGPGGEEEALFGAQLSVGEISSVVWGFVFLSTYLSPGLPASLALPGL